jgi:hypothetical protein
VGLAVLLACSAPAPVAVAVRPTCLQPLMSFREADSLARSYGFVTGFTLGMRQRADGWQASWPVGARWQSLAPGQLPGLQGRIAADSLLAYTHEPRCEYDYRVSYPVFTGPRATNSLRRYVDNAFDVLGILAERRPHPLFAYPAPHEASGDSDEIYIDDTETEWDTCQDVGAYCLGADTLLSAHGSAYYIGHGAHGTCAVMTLNFSCARQRQLNRDEVFRPELQQALRHTVAIYAFQNEYLEWQAPDHPRKRFVPTLWPGGDLLTARMQEQETEERLRQWSDELRKPQAQHYTGGRRLFYLGESQFYFGPTGVVFCIGSDLSTWDILLPYAELPRYLRLYAW